MLAPAAQLVDDIFITQGVYMCGLGVPEKS